MDDTGFVVDRAADEGEAQARLHRLSRCGDARRWRSRSCWRPGWPPSPLSRADESPARPARPTARRRCRPRPSPRCAIAAPRPLPAERHLTRWAPLRRAVVARARPAAGARRVTLAAPAARPRGRSTPCRSSAGAVGPAPAARGCASACPCCPNGTTGWIPRRAAGQYVLVRHRLVVDRARAAAHAAAPRRAGLCGARRDRRGSVAHTGRRVPRAQPPPWVRQPDVRSRRLRDERPLAHAHGLARGRVRRHPRHRPAASSSPAGCRTAASGCATPTSSGSAKLMPIGTPVTIR